MATQEEIADLCANGFDCEISGTQLVEKLNVLKDIACGSSTILTADDPIILSENTFNYIDSTAINNGPVVEPFADPLTTTYEGQTITDPKAFWVRVTTKVRKDDLENPPIDNFRPSLWLKINNRIILTNLDIGVVPTSNYSTGIAPYSEKEFLLRIPYSAAINVTHTHVLGGYGETSLDFDDAGNFSGLLIAGVIGGFYSFEYKIYAEAIEI